MRLEYITRGGRGMKDLPGVIGYFSGIDTFIGLAGAALLVFLIISRTFIEHLLKRSWVPIVIASIFMILVYSLPIIAMTFAFLNARDAMSSEQQKQAQIIFDNALELQRKNLTECMADRESETQFTQKFSQPASVRCPGGGCFLQSGSCNRRSVWLSYAAPGGYYINSYEVEPGSMASGNLGGQEITAQDSEGRTTAVRYHLWCDPADKPGAGGGWANATLNGTISLQDESSIRAGIVAECTEKYPLPQAEG